MTKQAFTVAHHSDESRIELNSPLLMPKACGYLWNQTMFVQMNCRGFAVGQFMQPEPAKYSYAPNLEAKSFIQPEQPYYAHHPGRFFYVKDEETGELFSAPYEPCRQPLNKFNFSAGQHDIKWTIEHLDIEVTLVLTLTANKAMEVWSFSIKNNSDRARSISVYPYFSIGYVSWMNQSATFSNELNAIVANYVTPYQKVDDYFKQQDFKDNTFLLSEKAPQYWHANQYVFEGEGGLTMPDALKAEHLTNQEARYETPAAIMQFRLNLSQGETFSNQLLFGPAKDLDEVSTIRAQYFEREGSLEQSIREYQCYLQQPKAIEAKSEQPILDAFINQWLPRQVFYHGDVNRLTTDPQTRNLIQDNLGLCYIKPSSAREAILIALSQQESSGAMPDGILLHPDAELKYINQIPHADHSIWLPLFFRVYLDETNDTTLLYEQISFADGKQKQSVIEHIELALDWLIKARDHRGLSFIEQGDWCDPMNMVGYKGKGVSSWLSLATAYSLNIWCEIVEIYLAEYSQEKVTHYRQASQQINQAVNKYCWYQNWYGRGITDNNRLFGTIQDKEGSIFLNPQSWAILSGATSELQTQKVINAIDQHLMTPYGVMMLAPSYTHMHDDIGRVTQKHPGVAENGSVYNHASAFYAYSLYQANENDKAFEVLLKMLPNEQDALKRGQLPIYIPNYYRGAYYQHPEQAGRSSHLINTGTVAWVYRCFVEELCGLRGQAGNLIVNPKLPQSLNRLSGTRYFQGAVFNFAITRADIESVKVECDGELVADNIINKITKGQSYHLVIEVP